MGLSNSGPNGISTTQTSEVWVYQSNPGSTAIPYWTLLAKYTGRGIQYRPDTTLGDSFVIREPGVYSCIARQTYAAGGHIFGISLNSTQISTSIAAINVSSILAIGNVAAAADQGSVCSVTSFFYPGDVIRPHMDAPGAGVGTANPNEQFFKIVKVS